MRRLLDWGRKILLLHGSPRGIALGFALGLALSLFPIPFAGMLVALALAPLVRASPAATYLGTAVVNPFTAPAFYFGELWLGATLLGTRVPDRAELIGLDAWGWWGLFREFLLPFGIGAAIMMAAAFALGLGGLWAILRWWRSRSRSAVLS